ncbi:MULTISPECIES: benzoate-CoA ligase family protein [Sorangium]|uniref:4-hydroxybenzoate--CoA ligase n=1 Tax=Sorangium cellulosum TaxID=56 RepID=A0A4V0NFP4_SORCE|nr:MULTISPECIES: benzoate-CoA ligase family protein [Sorangium]AUX30382.1 4-hydroxybenzoate--CoA ligase [Sorangium cellulosum]WCQ89776.1 Benzoate--CoA ligase [Sorangium sp. Soce836]
MSAPTFPEEFNLADYYLFDRLREGLGDKVALLFGDQRHTYADVAEQVRRLRAHLAVEDVAPEQRVLIVLHDSPAFVWAFFAALHHGAVVAMGNPEAPAADLAYLVEYTRAAAVVTIPRVADAIQGALAAADLRTLVLAPEVPTGGDLEADLALSPALDRLRGISLRDALAQGRAALVPRSAPVVPRLTRRDDVAIWLFTSGSTGRSKAAIHTHRDFAFNTERYAKATVGYRRDDVTVSVPRLFFGYATGTNLMFPFAVGATAGLFVERPTPESLTRYIERYRPTVVTNVPTMMGKLLDHDDARAARGEPRLDLSSVRFHLSAGEALPPALLERFRARFQADVYDGIGSAEMFHIYCTNRPGDVRPGSLGRVVDGYTIKILPSDAVGPGAPELPPGETGVMWVKGDSVALGYFQDRDKSWSTFHGHWCRTGDLFRMDAEGYLWFSGRADELLKVGGVWVAPVEVEECLTEHPAVSLAAVIGAEEAGLVKPKAFIVVRDDARGRVATEEGRAELAAELKAFVKDRLSKHKYPRWVVFVDDVPRNDRGKVDRKALRQREAAGANPAGL